MDHQFDGPFIAEDPDCPMHGTEAQGKHNDRDLIIQHLDTMLAYGTAHELVEAVQKTLDYLRSL